jgi:hypothetical protein
MADDRTFFFPGTAECQPILGPYPPTFYPTAPLNTMGGYGGLLDLNDYNGSTGNANLFVKPDDVGTSAGINDNMPYFDFGTSTFLSPAWYVVRQVDFKDWVGVSGIFWRKTSFIMEVDIEPAAILSLGGFRDEAVNTALPCQATFNGDTPYGAGTLGTGGLQGNGVCLKAIITDPTTHLEVVKDSHIFEGATGVDAVSAPPLSFPRQVVQLNLTDITPEEMATMVLRVVTEQYGGHRYPPHAALDSTIYRIGLTPDPDSLRSSGKQSAAMTTR